MEKATHEHEDAVPNYVNQIVEVVKPGAGYKLAAPNIIKAHSAFEKFELKPTAKSDREKVFNRVAAAYVGGLFDKGYDSPELAGGELKNYLSKHPREGALGRVYTAIERGDKIGLESELKEAFESHIGSNKLETTLSDVRNQPDETKMGVYGDLAKLLGDVDGYKGSAVSVSENLPGAIQGLQQRLAIAESVSKPKGGDNASH